MATFTKLTEDDARALCEACSLGSLVAVIAIPEGSVNSNFRLLVEGDRAWFVRIFEEQGDEGASYDRALVSHLAARGVPTPAPLTTTFRVAGKPVAVFPFVRGSSTCQRAVDGRRASALGRALARIHVGGNDFAIRRTGRFRIEDLFARLPRIAAASDSTLAAMAPIIEAELTHWTAARVAGVPEGVIHGDLFRDNVLWRAESGEGYDEIAALLDFESASDGRFVYDLAVTVLAWSMGDTFDASIAAAVLAGYESVRPLAAIERDAFRAELAIAALRFTTTRITDYAMRGGEGRVMKDWRRFYDRFRAVQTIDAFWLTGS
jgi:homoserine kinase type II